jgi:transcriptional antiterminator
MDKKKHLNLFKGVLYLILKYKIEGLSNTEIAQKLAISERTVLSQICIIKRVLKANGIDAETVIPRPSKYKNTVQAEIENEYQNSMETYEYWKKYNFEGRIKTLEIINIEKMLGI